MQSPGVTLPYYAAEMDALLVVKIGCLVGLLVVTLICGLIPSQVKWFHSSMARGKKMVEG